MMRIYRPFWGIGLIVSLAILMGIDMEESLWCSARAISRVPTTHKIVAITIDDGPHGSTTPEILAVLREKNVRVTFFVLGINAERNPKLLAQEVKDGHEIGSHGYSHMVLSRLPRAQIEEELTKTEKAIMAVGPKPILFRPPGGGYNKKVLELVQHKGYTLILWSVDPEDWRRPSVDNLVEHVLTHVRSGSIVLLHDGQHRLPTPKAIGAIVDRLRSDGYELVTMSELLQYYEVRSSH